jgi:hypothetical protein
MNEQEIIEKLKSKGYQKVYIYDAEPGEIDQEYQHDFETQLIVLDGQIQITSLINGVITNMSHQHGSHIIIERNTSHSAKVGDEGCRYIVCEKH